MALLLSSFLLHLCILFMFSPYHAAMVFMDNQLLQAKVSELVRLVYSTYIHVHVYNYSSDTCRNVSYIYAIM